MRVATDFGVSRRGKPTAQSVSTMPNTVYSVTDERGVTWPVTCAERAERLSRAGLQVTATTWTE